MVLMLHLLGTKLFVTSEQAQKQFRIGNTSNSIDFCGKFNFRRKFSGLLWSVISALWSSEPTAAVAVVMVHNTGQTEGRLITMLLLRLLISEQVYAISNSLAEGSWEVNSRNICGHRQNVTSITPFHFFGYSNFSKVCHLITSITW